jgi:hypothetical protein
MFGLHDTGVRRKANVAKVDSVSSLFVDPLEWRYERAMEDSPLSIRVFEMRLDALGLLHAMGWWSHTQLCVPTSTTGGQNRPVGVYQFPISSRRPNG